MIHCDNISRQYGDLFAVDSVSFSVKSGELVALVGPSGCGKSTTLKMINRLIEPTNGIIKVNGQSINDLSLTELRRKMGYVIQSTGLFPHWTVAKNISTVPKLLNWSHDKTSARVAELMELLGLTPIEEFKHKYPHELSGGQAQRVGVARALAASPDILLMDEPFGALDPITRQVLQKEVRRIQQKTKTTVIFVTHDMDEALAIADKIAIMKKGKLIQFGRPIELLLNPVNDFVRTFIGQSDLGLKLLSQRKVEQYISEAQLVESESTHYWQIDEKKHPKQLIGAKPEEKKQPSITHINEEWLATPDMSMKEALSRMIWYRVKVLPVVNPKGELMGEISLKAMMQPPKNSLLSQQID